MKIQNREFNVAMLANQQRADGTIVNTEIIDKASLCNMIAPLVKTVPEDKRLDLDYIIKANELLKKIEHVKTFEEFDLTESEFNLFKSVGETFKVGYIVDGMIEFKKFIRDLKYQE